MLLRGEVNGGRSKWKERKKRQREESGILFKLQAHSRLPAKRKGGFATLPPTHIIPGFFGVFFPATGGIMVRPKYVDEETHR